MDNLSEKSTNCRTCGVILNSETWSRRGIQNCKNCLQNRRAEINNLKQQKDNTKKCTKCKYFKPNEEYIKPPAKTCLQC